MVRDPCNLYTNPFHNPTLENNHTVSSRRSLTLSPSALLLGISEPMQVAETFAMTIPKEELEGNDTLKELMQIIKQQRGSGRKSRKKRAASGGAAAAAEAFSLGSFARLDTCVTVVDSSRFYDDLHSIEELKDR